MSTFIGTDVSDFWAAKLMQNRLIIVISFFFSWMLGAIMDRVIKPRIKLAGDIFEVNKRRSAYMQLLHHKFHPCFPLTYDVESRLLPLLKRKKRYNF